LRRAIPVALVLLFLASGPAYPQASHRRAAPRRVAPKTATDADAERRDAGGRIGDQIKSLTQFLYLLGGVAKGIESAELAARNGEASPAVVQQTQRNKDTVRSSIRNVQVGLEQLESDFSTKPSLRPFYPNLLGVADIGKTAEGQAAAGQYDQAGRSLLKVVGRLTDTLLAMNAGPR
jgi:hypothetical protein